MSRNFNAGELAFQKSSQTVGIIIKKELHCAIFISGHKRDADGRLVQCMVSGTPPDLIESLCVAMAQDRDLKMILTIAVSKAIHGKIDSELISSTPLPSGEQKIQDPRN